MRRCAYRVEDSRGRPRTPWRRELLDACDELRRRSSGRSIVRTCGTVLVMRVDVARWLDRARSIVAAESEVSA
jgi:hypothetical protein